MDDIVLQALAKWPNVPHCYGWLGLDARGGWYMRDDAAQAAGPFAPQDGATPQSRGSLLRHDKLVEFIQRNYEHDQTGQWFFQNGPQRVYVELEAAPWVWRLDRAADGAGAASVTSHTGRPALPRGCVVDETGRVYLHTDLGLGLVHTLDVGLAAEAVDRGVWVPQEMTAAELPQRFGYVRSPAARS